MHALLFFQSLFFIVLLTLPFKFWQVMEILSHVNKRVKHQMEIQLPLLELWTMYREDNAVPIVRNFCIVYIEMAFDRLPLEVSLSFLLCWILFHWQGSVHTHSFGPSPSVSRDFNEFYVVYQTSINSWSSQNFFWQKEHGQSNWEVNIGTINSTRTIIFIMRKNFTNLRIFHWYFSNLIFVWMGSFGVS